MRVPIETNDGFKDQLSCEGVLLESAFLDPQASCTIVFVFYVELDAYRFKAASPVIKYSKTPYAIPNSRFLKLATLEYYRNYEGDACGVGDEMEGRYQEDVRSCLNKNGTFDVGTISMMSGNVTYGTEDFWIFCTSVEPTVTLERDYLRRVFKADCETRIENTSEFAAVLGTDFAAHYTWSDVCYSPIEKTIQTVASLHNCDRMVWVYHGPVLYTDNAAVLIGSLPVQHRSAVVSFIKRRMFARQSEYRFKVNTRGRLSENQLFLPISPELERLAQIL